MAIAGPACSSEQQAERMPRGAAHAVKPASGLLHYAPPFGDCAAFRGGGRASGRRASPQISTGCAASNKGHSQVLVAWGRVMKRRRTGGDVARLRLVKFGHRSARAMSVFTDQGVIPVNWPNAEG